MKFSQLLRLVSFAAVISKGCLILCLGLYQSVPAQELRSPGAQFLLLSPSAVANGLGGGLVAASTEASAIYYNPAALARLGRIELEGNTFKLSPGLSSAARYYHSAGALRSGAASKWWFGAAYSRANLDEQIFRGEESPMPLGTFQPYESALALAAAVKLGQHARLGAGFKFVHVNFGLLPPIIGSSLKEASASGFAIDLGFLYDGFLPSAHVSRQILNRPLPWQKWAHNKLPAGFSFGAALANVGATLKLRGATQGEPLPQNLRVGLVWNVIDTDVLGLIATGEFKKILIKSNGKGGTDGAFKALFTAWTDQGLREELSQADYSGGLEVSLLQVAAVRFGRYWEGIPDYGYNTFGYSIGPPALRFSFARLDPFGSPLFDEWHIYTLSAETNKLPF